MNRLGDLLASYSRLDSVHPLIAVAVIALTGLAWLMLFFLWIVLRYITRGLLWLVGDPR